MFSLRISSVVVFAGLLLAGPDAVTHAQPTEAATPVEGEKAQSGKAQSGEAPPNEAQAGQVKSVNAETAEYYAAFEKRLSDSSLIGSFTMSKDTPTGDTSGGKEKPLIEERYDIQSVKKAKQGDYWIIKARIRYGDHDVAVPVPVEVKWAGDKAVIMVNKVPVPGLGTFDAHVLINGDQYAGTWRHDDVGGHMFGRIEKTAELDEAESTTE